MIDFTDSVIEQLAVHRVGYKVREENNFVSEALTPIQAHIEELLMNYFNKSFLNIPKLSTLFTILICLTM